MQPTISTKNNSMHSLFKISFIGALNHLSWISGLSEIVALNATLLHKVNYSLA